jgi:hypothetical protein
MDRFLSITGMLSDFSAVVQLIWTVLPRDVRLAVVPKTAVLAARGAPTGMWEGLDSFPSWQALKEAILAYYLPLAQAQHVKKLFALQFRPGKGLQFRDTFLQHLSILTDAYVPNAALLLKHLQSVQYSKLAAVASVFMNGSAQWLPDQWSALLDAMVEADMVFAGKTDTDMGTTPKKASDGPPTANPPAAPWRQVKRKERGPRPPKNLPKRKRPTLSQGSGPSHQKAGGAVDQQEKFRAVKWADPDVQKAADEGRCINCLKKGHFGRDCPEPKVFRHRLSPGGQQGRPGKGKQSKNA